MSFGGDGATLLEVQVESTRQWHVAAVLVSATAVVMAVVYVAVIHSQGDSPTAWVIGALAIAAGLSGYAATPLAQLGPGALAVAGFVLVVVGVLGIFSIGLPLLAAGIAAIASSWRRLSHH